MGRKKKLPEMKKQKLSVTISETNALKFKEHDIKNKSKLIDWLLMEHFGIEEGGQSE